MIYLSSFKLSDRRLKNPNIYPYNVFIGKDMDPFVFSPITVFYGNNGCGKSTLLNIMANKLGLKGREHATSNQYGRVDYCAQFESECFYSLGDNEYGAVFRRLPENSRYIKSEDILYEIKKIQQARVLERDMEYLLPDGLYLLDEPEVSLSPQNQAELAEKINRISRFLGCQFIIATHSPFMLGVLNAKIYNLDTECFQVQNWTELENVRYFYDFFKQRDKEFN